jgi:hypothetical protein
MTATSLVHPKTGNFLAKGKLASRRPDTSTADAGPLAE